MEPDYTPVWLHKPVPALDDEKPIELLARGEWKPVARLASSLESPGFSQRVPLDVDTTRVGGVWFRHVP